MKPIPFFYTKSCIKYTSTIIFLIFINFCTGQNNEVVDSFLKVLEKQSQDTSRVNALNELSWLYLKNNPTQAKKYANEAKLISESLGYQKGRITGMTRLGTIALFEKELDLAEKLYLSILDEENETKNTYGIGRAQNQLGQIYLKKGDGTKSLDFSLKSLDIFETINRKNAAAIVATNIGDIYKVLGQFDKALEYFLKGLQINKKLNNIEGIASSHLNLGALYILTKNHKKAIEYLHYSENAHQGLNNNYQLAKVYNNLGVAYFSEGKTELSLKYYNKSLNLYKGLGTAFTNAKLYNNLGTLYLRKNQLDLAMEYYQKSISTQKHNNEITSLEAYWNVAKIFFMRGNYSKAIEQNLIALDLAENSNLKLEQLKIVRNLRDCYIRLSNSNLALKYSSRYISLNDEIETTYKNAVNLQERYEASQKKTLELENKKIILEKDIKLGQASLNRFKTESEQKQMINYGLLIVLSLVVFLFISIIKTSQAKQKERIAKEQRRIQELEIKQVLKDKEVESLNNIMDKQQEERQRIAQDLHDRLGSLLSTVKMYFKTSEENIEKIKSINLSQYQMANKLLDEACDEVRKIAHQMSSSVLAKFGLVVALEDFKQILEKSNQIEVEFITHGMEKRLDKELEVPIYLIIQELINNIIKHAKAKLISIQLVNSKGNLNLTVEDDGVGFDPHATDKMGMGIKGVYSRAEKLKGKTLIDSTPGNGTTVTINLPING